MRDGYGGSYRGSRYRGRRGGGLGKGLLLVCLAVWVLSLAGVLTEEVREGSVLLKLAAGVTKVPENGIL